jgi:asparagine synthase (glutamine-hydrolysing)
MITVKLDNRYGRAWFTKGHWTCSGHIFWQEALLKQSKLAEWLDGHDDDFLWPQSLQSTNGFFSLVRHEGEKLLAAVDRVRSIPLFYGCRNDSFFLSDNAEWVRVQVGDTTFDEVFKTEFLLTRHVTGPDTLYQNVKQLPAGCCISVTGREGKYEVEPHRYCLFPSGGLRTDVEDEQALCVEMDDLHERIMGRLIAYANGRCIVIPLSGGSDSRLLAAILKRMRYDNVICFSYGRTGNQESETSRQVSERLGYPWHFVMHTNSMWREWFESEQRQEYYRFADGLSVLPHIQDVLAVRELKKRRIIPDDSVLAPGHCYDFPPGSLFPKRLFYHPSSSREFVAYNWDLHYAYQDSRRFDPRVLAEIQRRMLDQVTDYDLNDSLGAVRAFDSWVWSERVSKFVVNSVRVYDFYGYDWCMPFWYKEVMDWWERIPPELRVDKRLHARYMKQWINDPMGLPDTYKSHGTLWVLLRSVLKRLGLMTMGRRRARAHDYEYNPIAFYGVMPPDTFEDFMIRNNTTGRRDINSYLAAERIGWQ